MNTTAISTTENINPVSVFRHELGSMENQFQAALPAHIPVERFVRVLQTSVQQNPDLLKCSRRSLWNSAMKAAQDGLLPDGREGAIVPYKGQAQWMPMIAGIRKKVRNSGEIATWDAHVVYEKDEFSFALGDEPHILHKPSLGDRGNPIAAYSIAVLKSGEKSREVMSVAEIESVRARSAAKNNGPWVTDWSEMARKTVARRHSKVLPMSTDLDDLIRRDDELYQFDEAKEQDKASGRGTLASRLDALASVPHETPHDPETGEVKQEIEVVQHDSGRIEQNTPPRSPEAQSADVGADNRSRIGESFAPATPEEYADSVHDYIAGSDDSDLLETRWREERQLRSRIGVPVADAKILGEQVLAKAKELRGQK
jgi:recombination protein RecT